MQVNAVRALGHLFTVQHPSLSQQREQLPGCSSQQHPACAATTYLNSEGTPDDEVPSCGQVNCSCGQVDCSCGSASCSQQCDNGRSSWWGEEWLVQGTQCLLSCLGSSTDKVWLGNKHSPDCCEAYQHQTRLDSYISPPVLACCTPPCVQVLHVVTYYY